MQFRATFLCAILLAVSICTSSKIRITVISEECLEIVNWSLQSLFSLAIPQIKSQFLLGPWQVVFPADSVAEAPKECSVSNTFGEYFPSIQKIKFEGPETTNTLAFRYYNAEEKILGKPMKEWYVHDFVIQCLLQNFSLKLASPLISIGLFCWYWNFWSFSLDSSAWRLRFAVAFWHTFRGDGADQFGSPTKVLYQHAHRHHCVVLKILYSCVSTGVCKLNKSLNKQCWLKISHLCISILSSSSVGAVELTMRGNHLLVFLCSSGPGRIPRSHR